LNFSFLSDALVRTYLRWTGKKHLIPLFNSLRHAGRPAAVERAARFEAAPIMDRLLRDCGLRLPILKAHDVPAIRREPVPSR
jgi:hypothetical protein